MYTSVERVTSNTDVFDNKDIFIKNVAWSYEKECRVLFRIKGNMREKIKKLNNPIVRVQISSGSLKILRKNLYKSPVLKKDIDVGNNSVLYNSVEWEIGNNEKD